MPRTSTKKPKKATDPRSSLLAIQLIRSLLKRYPAKELWDYIITTIGDNPDQELLEKSLLDWTKRNYNPFDLRWLDWYKTRLARRQEQLSYDREQSFRQFRSFIPTA